jgi:hypothetical protein
MSHIILLYIFFLALGIWYNCIKIYTNIKLYSRYKQEQYRIESQEEQKFEIRKNVMWLLLNIITPLPAIVGIISIVLIAFMVLIFITNIITDIIIFIKETYDGTGTN